ncbi:MAG: carbon-nitrogen hydrolase family protein [Desulfobacterales bacterium]
MKNQLTLALAQVEPNPDPAANLEKAASFARRAAARNAHLIVFPEMFMGLPTADRSPAQIASADQGGFISGLGTLAAETGLHIMAGCWEAGPEAGKVYNTAMTLSPQGETLAAYRKLHLFDALSVKESDTMLPGDALPEVLEINGVRVGVGICYDLRFPEFFRYLAEQGAQAVLLPSAWYQGPMKEAHWLTLLRARAIENTLYVAGCNLVGPAFCGRSAAFDPFGVPLAGAGEVETLIEFAVEPQRVEAVRQKLPALQNRRRDLLD